MAKRERKAEAQVVRELLEQGLQQRSQVPTNAKGLLGLAELGRKLNIKLPVDTSANIDKILYEDE